MEETRDEKLIMNFGAINKDTKQKVDHTWDCNKQLDRDVFLEKCNIPFEIGGWVESDSKNTCGYRIREVDKFKDVGNIVYLLVFLGKILKGGKSKKTLRKRSYAAGTEKNWLNPETGNGCSETNYIWSQIFRKYCNGEIKFYVYAVPTIKVEYPTCDAKKKYVEISAYEEVEKDLNLYLTKTLGRKVIGEGNLLQPNKS